MISSAAPHRPTAYSILAQILSSPSFLKIVLQFFLGIAQTVFDFFEGFEGGRDQRYYALYTMV